MQDPAPVGGRHRYNQFLIPAPAGIQKPKVQELAALDRRCNGDDKGRVTPSPQPRVPVHVLVQQIAKFTGATGITGLRAEGPEPHEITRFNFDPVLVEFVNSLAFQYCNETYAVG